MNYKKASLENIKKSRKDSYYAHLDPRKGLVKLEKVPPDGESRVHIKWPNLVVVVVARTRKAKRMVSRLQTALNTAPLDSFGLLYLSHHSNLLEIRVVKETQSLFDLMVDALIAE